MLIIKEKVGERERERHRERKILLLSSNVIYNLWGKKIKVSCNKCESSHSWCSRTLFVNVLIESAHYHYERNSCKDWVSLEMCRKQNWIWSREKNFIKVWHSNPQTCSRQCVISLLLSSLVPRYPISHRNDCKLMIMEPIIRIANNGMGYNMYWCAWLPPWEKNTDCS